MISLAISWRKTLRCQAVTNSALCRWVRTAGGANRARTRRAAALSGSGRYHLVTTLVSKYAVTSALRAARARLRLAQPLGAALLQTSDASSCRPSRASEGQLGYPTRG